MQSFRTILLVWMAWKMHKRTRITTYSTIKRNTSMHRTKLKANAISKQAHTLSHTNLVTTIPDAGIYNNLWQSRPCPFSPETMRIWSDRYAHSSFQLLSGNFVPKKNALPHRIKCRKVKKKEFRIKSIRERWFKRRSRSISRCVQYKSHFKPNCHWNSVYP